MINYRAKNEMHTWPITIFDEEMIKLQTVYQVSAEAIGEYVKPYSHYKRGFDKMRSKKKA